MTNARWFGVYKHSIGHRQFTCGLGVPSPDLVTRMEETPLLYLIKVKMKDGSVPSNQPLNYPNFSF